MSEIPNYEDAVKAIKTAILQSQYDAACRIIFCRQFQQQSRLFGQSIHSRMSNLLDYQASRLLCSEKVIARVQSRIYNVYTRREEICRRK